MEFNVSQADHYASGWEQSWTFSNDIYCTTCFTRQLKGNTKKPNISLNHLCSRFFNFLLDLWNYSSNLRISHQR